jgi:hypothetical protein
LGGGEISVMLDELGNLGDFVGGLAVVVTLIYLALQIRQNTATTRVQTVQHLLTSDTASADSMIAGPLPDILVKLDAGERLTPGEASAYTLYMRGRLTEAWQVFYQRQNRMIEKEVAAALLGRFEFFARAALFRAVWHRNLKIGFPAEFQEYVESQIAEGREQADVPS